MKHINIISICYIVLSGISSAAPTPLGDGKYKENYNFVMRPSASEDQAQGYDKTLIEFTSITADSDGNKHKLLYISDAIAMYLKNSSNSAVTIYWGTFNNGSTKLEKIGDLTLASLPGKSKVVRAFQTKDNTAEQRAAANP